MRILITGGKGQLGRSLQRALDGYEAVALGHAELDVANQVSVADVVAQHRPDVVVHCAAFTDTAACEREPSVAHAVNALGGENVARACAAAGARLIPVSTDEVFDGEKSSPYGEADTPNPLNAYARSKVESEQLIAAACDDALIVRTSWLYGDGGNNFPSKVLAAARAGRALRFVTNEVSAPTSTDDLADAIRALIDNEAHAGIYHLVNEGEASRYEWAKEILRLGGMAVVSIEPVTMQELRADGYDGPRKPEYSVLANTRARALGITLRPWREALADYFTRQQVATDA